MAVIAMQLYYVYYQHDIKMSPLYFDFVNICSHRKKKTYNDTYSVLKMLRSKWIFNTKRLVFRCDNPSTHIHVALDEAPKLLHTIVNLECQIQWFIVT